MKKIILVILIGLLAISGMAQKKNVLFIAVDDLKPMLGCYGHEQIKSPNIDQLASQGTAFLNNHCQQAVCAPSRVSLLTGLRPDVTKVWDLKTQMRDKNPNILTLPQYFKEQGYTTAGIGKIFDPRSVDKKLDEVSWSIPFVSRFDVDHPVFGAPAARGFQSPEIKAQAEEIRKEGEAKGLKGGKLNNYITENLKPSVEKFACSDDAYVDGYIAKKAVEMMNQLAGQKEPFMLCVGFKKPHLPFVAPAKYWDMYDEKDIQLASWQKHSEKGPDIAYHKFGELQSYTDMPQHVKNGKVDEAKQRELINGYYACVSYIDAQIGLLMDNLKKNGLSENTIVVLWGDHGWHLGDHGLWCKHSNFEQATRSPLIIYAPGMPANNKISSPTEFIDIFPTLCELNDLKTPSILQGTSLVPVLNKEKNSVKKYAISQYPRGKAMGYALRTDRYRYVEWHNNYKSTDVYKTSNLIAAELYDYENDPLETRNLLNEKSLEPIKDELQSELQNFLKSKKVKVKAKVNNPKSSDNLINSPSFEGSVKGWKTFGKIPPQISKTNQKNGDACINLVADISGISQNIDGLKPNTSYQLSAWVKSSKSQRASLTVSEYGGKEVKRQSRNNDYTRLVINFKTGPKNTGAVVSFQKWQSGGNSPAWADDFLLKEIVTNPKKATSTSGLSIKEIVQHNYAKDAVFIGATLGYKQLGTEVESLFLKDFTYLTPENAAKQTNVHPNPGTWNWNRIDQFVNFANKEKVTIRLHGPISPQCSKWTKNDGRTAEELDKNMTEYMIALCKKFNGNLAVRWMDVVNETVQRDGTWFGPAPGDEKWENPWTQIGFHDDKNHTPVYITKAFELAQANAPDIKLVYNQHGGMEPAMWEKVKETILFLRSRGLRVDGLGWQAHLKSGDDLAFDKERLDYFSNLIDWAHSNELEFHVTEIDYKIEDGIKSKANYEKQGKAYGNILKVLLSKRNSGVVTYNTWGITDNVGRVKDIHPFIYDDKLQAKPAYYTIIKTLENPDLPLELDIQAMGSKHVFISDGFENFKMSPWVAFGKNKPTLSSNDQRSGKQCIKINGDRSGINQLVKGLKSNTSYQLSAWIKALNNERVTLKVSGHGHEDVKKGTNKSEYTKVSLEFTTGASNTQAKIICQKWTSGNSTAWIDDVELIEK